MSIANVINSIQTHLINAYASLNNKGAIIPENKNIENLSNSINSIQSGVTPTGTINITENCITDVTNYASANVNVPSTPINNQDKTITENGTYTADNGYTGLGNVTVNVSGGGQEILDAIIDGTITGSLTSNATKIMTGHLGYCRNLTSLNMPEVTEIGTNGLVDCTNLINLNVPKLATIISGTFMRLSNIPTLDLPLLTSVPTNGIRECSKLTSLNIPLVTTIGDYGLYQDQLLPILDLPSCTKLNSACLRACTALDTLILRSTTVCNLVNVNAFMGTPIESGTGLIYVPDDLVDSYKSATNWSTFSTQIKGISELPS